MTNFYYSTYFPFLLKKTLNDFEKNFFKQNSDNAHDICFSCLPEKIWHNINVVLFFFFIYTDNSKHDFEYTLSEGCVRLMIDGFEFTKNKTSDDSICKCLIYFIHSMLKFNSLQTI